MTTFSVKLSISAVDNVQNNGVISRTYRINYLLVSGQEFLGSSGVAVLTTGVDAPINIGFAQQDDHEIVGFLHSNWGAESVRVNLMTSTFKVPVSDTDLMEFSAAIELAFFDAINALVITCATVQMSVAQTAVAEGLVVSHSAQISQSTEGNTAKARFGRFFRSRNLIVVGLLFGGAVTVYGMVGSRTGSDVGIKAAMAGDGYEDLQAQIRAQIQAAAKSDSPLLGGTVGGLGGQNVAIETMKAMGLDPGKANAGCLVGVK